MIKTQFVTINFSFLIYLNNLHHEKSGHLAKNIIFQVIFRSVRSETQKSGFQGFQQGASNVHCTHCTYSAQLSCTIVIVALEAWKLETGQVGLSVEQVFFVC